MREEWIAEQLAVYDMLTHDGQKQQIIDDLKQAADFTECEDWDTVYRITAGIAELMRRKK